MTGTGPAPGANGHEVDFDALCRELVRDLRGRQTTRSASLRLGYTSNPVARWESGERIPPASDVLRLAFLQGRDVLGAAQVLTDTAPSRLVGLTPRDDDFVPAIVRSYLDVLPAQDLVEVTGLSRHQLGRMARGDSRVRMPDLLRIMHLANGTMAMFLVRFADMTQLPSAAEIWLQYDRECALRAEVPFIMVMLYALDREDYRALPAHDDAWMARLLGFPEHEIAHAYARAAYLGLIDRVDDKWVPRKRRRFSRSRLALAQERELCARLTEEAARRIRGGLGTVTWRTFRVSDDDLVEIAKALTRGLDEAAHHLVQEDGNRLGYLMMHLVSLDGEPFLLRAGSEPPKSS